MSCRCRLPRGRPTMHCSNMVQPGAKAINKVNRGGFQTTAVSTLALRVSTWLPRRSEALMTGSLGAQPADWLRAGASNHTGADDRAAVTGSGRCRWAGSVPAELSRQPTRLRRRHFHPKCDQKSRMRLRNTNLVCDSENSQ